MQSYHVFLNGIEERCFTDDACFSRNAEDKALEAMKALGEQNPGACVDVQLRKTVGHYYKPNVA